MTNGYFDAILGQRYLSDRWCALHGVRFREIYSSTKMKMASWYMPLPVAAYIRQLFLSAAIVSVHITG
ncbi:MAG: hypothetical protein V3581_02340 [Candidatus Cardinium sp.]|nr:hypothetical protein [Candidatus Cardinium sp.]